MSVESLLTQMGINYRIIDDEAVARCPYHSDSHPSWSVNIRNGLHYCFSCGARGTIASLIHDFLGYSYAESVIMANETIGHAVMDKWRERYDSISMSPTSIKVTEADMALFIEPPKEMLISRNINSAASHNFGIKWNPVKNTWIFPYRDPFSNELWGWQEKGERVFRNFPAGTKRSRTLFGYKELYPKGPAYLLESPIDCAVLQCAGYNNGVASFGIMTGIYQLSLLQYKRVHTLIMCYDNDEAGIQATRDLLPKAMNMFRQVKVFNYKEAKAKDPGEMNDHQIEVGIEEAIPAMRWIHYGL